MARSKAIKTYGGFTADCKVFKMTDTEFTEWAGGKLAVNLFHGTFRGTVSDIVWYARARGIYWAAHNKGKVS